MKMGINSERFFIYGEESSLLTELDIQDRKIRLHKEVNDPLLALVQALTEARLPIKIVSHWRSFEYQSMLWHRKWRGEKPIVDRHSQPLDYQKLSLQERFNAICHWSALPGTSRHHWGTDFDIFLQQPITEGYDVQLTTEEFSESGPCHTLNEWLNTHLASFGFYRPYSTFRGGVSPEPWHISYQSIAQQCLDNFRVEDLEAVIMEKGIDDQSFITQQLHDYVTQYVKNVD